MLSFLILFVSNEISLEKNDVKIETNFKSRKEKTYFSSSSLTADVLQRSFEAAEQEYKSN